MKMSHNLFRSLSLNHYCGLLLRGDRIKYKDKTELKKRMNKAKHGNILVSFLLLSTVNIMNS